MDDIEVIDDPRTAAVLLEPARANLLAQLDRPKSASTVAAESGLPRQRLNYHLHALERCGLVELVEERRKGNMTERLVRSSARSYVISPDVLAVLAPRPAQMPGDRLSAYWLLATAAQLVSDVGALVKGASRGQRHVATFTMDAEVRFSSPAQRAAFADELSEAVSRLVAKYHDARSPGGRAYKMVVAVHPKVRPGATKDQR
ncbi:MAG TPA: helix-turn-helix domain-containing protein [Acidimicrobiales bacterium]|nr:helix-turn-helix domain-containing protein [Acidimicrobiales bacterium]